MKNVVSTIMMVLDHREQVGDFSIISVITVFSFLGASLILGLGG
jgi:hypothetical protein